MRAQFSDETVAEEYWIGPERHRNEAFQFMLRRFAKLYHLPDFNMYIQKETLVRLMGAVGAQASAKERLHAALEWVAYDERHRMTHLEDLLREIPAALLSSADLKFLRTHHLVRRSASSAKFVDAMISIANRPYYQDKCQFDTAMNITPLRDSGGKKLFAYTALHNKVEFQVLVSCTRKLEHLLVSIRCTNIHMHNNHSLPRTARAHIIIKLCQGKHGENAKMHLVDLARIEEQDLPMVRDGNRIPFHRRLDMLYYPSDMKHLVEHQRKISLFVQIKQFYVNGVSHL